MIRRFLRFIFGIPDPKAREHRAGYAFALSLLACKVEPLSLLAAIEAKKEAGTFTTFDDGVIDALIANGAAIRHLLEQHHG